MDVVQPLLKFLLELLLQPLLALEPPAATLLELPFLRRNPLPPDHSSAGTPFCAFLAPIQNTAPALEALLAPPPATFPPPPPPRASFA